jgi:predicted nucleotidyltransferase component of viral defense system
MAEAFLHLTPVEQSQIYRALEPQLGRAPLVIEKDVWVCWVLQTLFSMPGRLPMAFKGDTSLSKVFGAIARFSEDV